MTFVVTEEKNSIKQALDEAYGKYNEERSCWVWTEKGEGHEYCVRAHRIDKVTDAKEKGAVVYFHKRGIWRGVTWERDMVGLSFW